MTDVIPLRPRAETGDGYSHRDVILDADRVWWQRTETEGRWHGFHPADRYVAAEMIPQPWTLVARANETVSLQRARDAATALEGENAQLLETVRRVERDDRPTDAELAIAGEHKDRPARLTGAQVLARAVLFRVNPLRGGA